MIPPENSAPLSPLMQQFFDIKREHSDTVLLFQVGDFYELFFDDAQRASAFLGITLTKRGTFNGEPIPLCGVPVHTVDHYLEKLIRGGFKVALCDQLEQAQAGKIVARGVTRVLTPGTLTDEKLMDARSASYIFSFFPHNDSWGLLFGELLTAQLSATILPAESEKMLESELTRFFPDEVLIPDSKCGKPFEPYFKRLGYFTTKLSDVSAQENGDNADYSDWCNELEINAKKIINQHEVVRHSLHTFYAYMRKTNHHAIDQFKSISWYEPEDFLLLDGATQRNLELIKNNHDGGRVNTLFSVLDGALTPMGSRTIKKWIMRPLVNEASIEQRQEVVGECVRDILLMQQLKEDLTAIGDVERLVGRIALLRASPADYRTLVHVLAIVPNIRDLLQKYEAPLLARIAYSIDNFSDLHALLQRALNDDSVRDWIIKKGFDEQLDQVRDLVEHAQRKIIELERREQLSTGINSLKVRYHQSHGYFIEITKSNFDAVPSHYIRTQSLIGRDRFMTEELRTLQYDIERARNHIEAFEKELFDHIKRIVAQRVSALRKCAYALAHLDALVGFARVAYDNNYIRPTLTKTRNISIEQGRHPVVEQSVGSRFIANDTQLLDEQPLWIITGPNMGGKSTYLRQVALISIMAQCGSFVPAQAACLPIVDRIFTRIGAGDNVAQGKSTFLVEMEETATICREATKNSLVILDEVGRGTSTFDGLAIAQAVVEYIHTDIGARCLFATHYHELTALAERFAGIVNYHAASKKTVEGVILLHKIVQGVADGSFGIEVARVADLPDLIIDRAVSIVSELSDPQKTAFLYKPATVHADQRERLMLDEGQKKVLKVLQNIDYEELSPKQAFDLLWRLKEHLQ